jgi:hypothetical protein
MAWTTRPQRPITIIHIFILISYVLKEDKIKPQGY